MITVRHPDAIPDLADDCRRVLRKEYEIIVARTQRPIPSEPMRIYSSQDIETEREARRQALKERAVAVAAAIAEYRRVAKMWGVDVG